MIDAKQISLGKAAKLVNTKGGILVDVRDPVSFRDGTVAGAINLSLRQLSSLQRYSKNTPIVLYSDKMDIDIKTAANYLIQFGFTHVNTLISKP